MIKLRLPRKELLSSDGIKGYMALYYLKKNLGSSLFVEEAKELGEVVSELERLML